MTKIRQYILESKQVGPIYHFTHVDFARGILKDNELRSYPHPKNIWKTDTISFTRDKRLPARIPTMFNRPVRFDIDGNKLSTRYKVQPFHDSQYLGDYAIKTDDEREERAVFKGKPPIIKDFLKYVKSITVTNENDKLVLDRFTRVPIIKVEKF